MAGTDSDTAHGATGRRPSLPAIMKVWALFVGIEICTMPNLYCSKKTRPLQTQPPNGASEFSLTASCPHLNQWVGALGISFCVLEARYCTFTFERSAMPGADEVDGALSAYQPCKLHE
eukprot:1864562-Rhodomonas_salina.1